MLWLRKPLAVLVARVGGAPVWPCSPAPATPRHLSVSPAPSVPRAFLFSRHWLIGETCFSPRWAPGSVLASEMKC